METIETPAKSMMDVTWVGLTTGGNIPEVLLKDLHSLQEMSFGKDGGLACRDAIQAAEETIFEPPTAPLGLRKGAWAE